MLVETAGVLDDLQAAVGADQNGVEAATTDRARLVTVRHHIVSCRQSQALPLPLGDGFGQFGAVSAPFYLDEDQNSVLAQDQVDLAGLGAVTPGEEFRSTGLTQ